MKTKKTSDYSLHATVIIGSILTGVALAACTPMTTQVQPVNEQQVAATASPVATPVVTPVQLESGEVQGVTTESYDQQVENIDEMMFAVDPEAEVAE